MISYIRAYGGRIDKVVRLEFLYDFLSSRKGVLSYGRLLNETLDVLNIYPVYPLDTPTYIFIPLCIISKSLDRDRDFDSLLVVFLVTKKPLGPEDVCFYLLKMKFIISLLLAIIRSLIL